MCLEKDVSWMGWMLFWEKVQIKKLPAERGCDYVPSDAERTGQRPVTRRVTDWGHLYVTTTHLCLTQPPQIPKKVDSTLIEKVFWSTLPLLPTLSTLRRHCLPFYAVFASSEVAPIFGVLQRHPTCSPFPLPTTDPKTDHLLITTVNNSPLEVFSSEIH